MINHHSLVILMSILLYSCSQEQKVELYSDKDIISLQEKAKTTSIDSSYVILKKVDAILQSQSNIADSLRTKNAYFFGEYFTKLGILDSSVFYYQKTVDLVQDPITFKKGRYYYFNAVEAYTNIGKFGDGVAIAQSYLKRIDEKDNNLKALGYLMLTKTYSKLEDGNKALETNQKQINALILAKDSLYLYSALMDKAKLLYFNQKNKLASYRLLDSLIQIEDKLNLDNRRVLYGNYGVYKYYDNDFPKANEFYLRSLEVKKKMFTSSDKNFLLATSYANLAEVSIQLKQYLNARAYLDTISRIGIHNIPKHLRKSVLRYEMRLANVTNQDLNRIFQIQDTLSKYQGLTYQDKVQNELVALKKANDNERKILKQKLETERKNTQLKSSLLWVGFITSIALLSGLFLYFKRKIKFERTSLQLQQRLLRSQMKPHFTFNTLSAIQHQVKKDPDGGSKSLLKFSRLLRLFLENSMTDYVLLEKEVESLRKYMDFQQMQTNNSFDYQFQFTNLEEDEFIFIPPMLLQPFIENAIEHGFGGIDYTGRISISLELKNKFIHCQIEDNGTDLSKKVDVGLKKSASVQLISEFLKKTTKQALSFENKSDKGNKETGIVVRFLIPYKLTEHD